MSQRLAPTIGPPVITDTGRDVFAFHLHRYLAHWLAKARCDRVWVTLGFEHADVSSVTIEVGRSSSSESDVPWTFSDLEDSYLHGSSQVVIERTTGPTQTLDSVPLREESVDGVPALLGFVLVDDGNELTPELVAELEVHASEAIRAARRNSIRLFFDDCDERDMKSLLYAALDRLPEWAGTDVAAAVVLADSLDAMSVEHASKANFYVMAERLFRPCDDDEEPTRFVGMSIDTSDDVRTVVDAALERLADEPDATIVRFRRIAEGYVDEDDQPATSIGRSEARPEDAASFVVPLVRREADEQELIGFLCLAFSRARGVPRSVDDALAQLADELAHLLRFSPLYTLSSSKLRLVRQVREVCEREVAREDESPDVRRSNIVRDVVALVRNETEIPAFAVGWIRDGESGRELTFETSFGWTDFDRIALPFETDGDHSDSGVSTLAVKLRRSLVLAGGRQHGDTQEFKNYLWVNEATGSVRDQRSPIGSTIDTAEWTRLGEYYKPARAGAYATVAHPIAFDGHPLGVVALEVDRDTNWYWWAGFGSQRLWELVSSELAFAFWALDRF